MKTVEGVELKLGKCKLMPVKKTKLTNEQTYELIQAGMRQRTRIVTPLKDESIQIIEKARMVKNPYLALMEKKYYDKVLLKIKPANYKD